jgi:uncharacterized protein
MKIIAIPDIHGRVDKIQPYSDKIAEADAVILAGDLTNGSLDTAQNVLKVISELNSNILTIPGNMDTDAIVDYTEQLGYNIHKTYRVIDGVAFVGMGGALPFAGRYIYNEHEFADIMTQAVDGIPDVPQILVCHQPPINTLNDRLYDGRQVGSTSVRAYIETHQPMVCFTGHIHEAVGIDTIGITQTCNPGPVWTGYATTEIIDGQVNSLEVHQLA